MGGKRKYRAELDLFVSYAGPDRAWAEWVAWHLQADGYTLELDVWDWAAGDNVVLRMSDALDRASRVLALWSPAYFERERFTTDEWTALMALRPSEGGQRRLVPIRVAEVTPPSILASLVYRDLFGLDEQSAKTVLLEAVQGQRDAGGRPEFPGSGKRKPPTTSAPRIPGTLPAVWNVPRRNAAFTGRVSVLADLRQQLCSGGSAVVQALHGFGGIGKTTLAAEYAHRFAGSYTAVWWINAEQVALISEQITALGIEAGWISVDAPTANPAALALQRLRVESNWLLIFDNAENREKLLPWLPQGSGHVLITSRSPGWDQIARSVALPEFSREESTALLRTSLPTLPDDRANQLAERLGDLPLALAQAAQTLVDTGLTVPDYLRLLDKQTIDILSDSTPANYPVPLAAVIRTAMSRIIEKDVAAGQVLHLCAFFGPSPIPTDLFTAVSAQVFPSPLAETVGSVLDFARTLRVIGAYGIAKMSEGTLQLHRLTQAVIRDSIDDSDRVKLRAQVDIIVASNAGLDDGKDPKRWPRWAMLLPHILAIDPASSESVDFRKLACHASSYLISRGDFKLGREFADHLYTEWAPRLGPDDAQALFAATNVANADTALGRYVDAYVLEREVYIRRRSLLGEDHPDTLVSVGNLSSTFSYLGRHDLAFAIDQDTYGRRRRTLGEDHPDTLLAANNLANSFGRLGRHEEALDLHNVSYVGRCRVLGDDHPDSLIAASSLASALNHLKRHHEAISLHRNVHDRRRRILGDDHPDSLSSLSDLGAATSHLGLHREALKFHQEAFSRRRRVLGDDHPDTINAGSNLAWALRMVGRIYDADKREKWVRMRKAPIDNVEKLDARIEDLPLPSTIDRFAAS